LFIKPNMTDESSSRSAQIALKRLLDVALACIALILVLPALAAICVVILVDSGPPVLFITERVGLNFSMFRIYKFRTMVKDAHARLPEVAHLNVAAGMIKIPNDPRVTRTGRWLRRFSLDEVPQFINVIRGDMSIVGPRPYARNEVSEGNLDDRERLSMRPGLTGLWQVSARSDPSIETRRQCDLDYVRGFTVRRDLHIMLVTIPTMFMGRGGQVTPPR
jgi:lipopolysaccharide/colanic/teichoic acid biosynthesis glycosyltransferase